MRDIYFWHSIVSPHMAGLAAALAQRGCRVTYVAEGLMSEDRRQLGWNVPTVGGVAVKLVGTGSTLTACLDSAGPEAIHICQGLRGNGYVRSVQMRLAARNSKQWVVMETVDDSGWAGPLKRAAYAAHFHFRRKSLQGVLATGGRTVDWVVSRGMPAEKVFPFCYFLEAPGDDDVSGALEDQTFRVAFVGKFVALKRLPLLVEALRDLQDRQFELSVIGSGPAGHKWRELAERCLPGRVRWVGGLPHQKVPEFLRSVDCLVLPSRHDGWGAVVSESLMVGTPAICSDRCGASEAVEASGVGGVFPHQDLLALRRLLATAMDSGRVTGTRRLALARWALSLGAQAGADYFLEILDYMDGLSVRPTPPWRLSSARCAA